MSSCEDKFGFSLSHSQVSFFLEKLGLSFEIFKNPLAGLNSFIESLLAKIPFQNLMMLIRPEISPTAEEIKEDMLLGLGGPCGTMNPFIGAVLDFLGFDTHLVAGSMQQPNCHLALLVYINGHPYYVDCGDGKPYLFAMPIYQGEQTYSHPFLTYKTYWDGNFFCIDNKIGKDIWKRNCTINLSYKPFAFFEDTIHNHYTKKEYGPFMTGIRIAYFPNTKIEAIKNFTYIYQTEDECKNIEIENEVALIELFNDKFASFNLPIAAALAKINQRNFKK